MTAFDWLKAEQTAVTLTSFVCFVTCAYSLLSRWDERYTVQGYLLTLGVLLMSIALLIVQGWQTGQYWLAGLDRPSVAPISIRLISNTFFLAGGAIFVAVTQQVTLGVGPTFVLWSTLIGMIVVMIAFAG